LFPAIAVQKKQRVCPVHRTFASGLVSPLASPCNVDMPAWPSASSGTLRHLETDELRNTAVGLTHVQVIQMDKAVRTVSLATAHLTAGFA